MLDIEDLTLDFVRYSGLLQRERLRVLDGVHLHVAAGELVVLVGASGAGKSLLAHAVLGILPPNAQASGCMFFQGAALSSERQRAMRGRQMALVPQSVTFLDPSARVAQQLRWAAQAAGVPHAPRHLLQELQRFGLDEAVLRRYPHELSGGMARRVLTAIATVSQAPLLIADEPTSGLDPDARTLMLAHLRALADEGRAVLVITHDVEAALAVADRLVVMRDGRTVATLAPERFLAGGTGHVYVDDLRAALPAHGFYQPAASETSRV